MGFSQNTPESSLLFIFNRSKLNDLDDVDELVGEEESCARWTQDAIWWAELLQDSGSIKPCSRTNRKNMNVNNIFF